MPKQADMPKMTQEVIDLLLQRFTRGFYTPTETKPLKQVGLVERARPGSYWRLTDKGRERAEQPAYI